MIVKKNAKLEVSDWELLQSLQESLASNLTAKDLGKKLSDLLKIVELKYKIQDESQREKIFWEMVEDLREEVLGEESRRQGEEKALNHEGTKKPEKHEKRRKREINKLKDKIMDEKEKNETNENVQE